MLFFKFGSGTPIIPPLSGALRNAGKVFRCSGHVPLQQTLERREHGGGHDAEDEQREGEDQVVVVEGRYGVIRVLGALRTGRTVGTCRTLYSESSLYTRKSYQIYHLVHFRSILVKTPVTLNLLRWYANRLVSSTFNCTSRRLIRSNGSW